MQKLTTTPDGDYCPVRATLALVGQKWVPQIIYELIDGKLRFNELATTVGGCNSRTLRDRLKLLEELGIVSRRIVATMPPWVEYQLTDLGTELAQALQPLARWGRSHLSDGLPAEPSDGAVDGCAAAATGIEPVTAEIR
ncbi:MAG: helix-turn-helix domain-containing protein [Dehalococcoidia bacterium]